MILKKMLYEDEYGEEGSEIHEEQSTQMSSVSNFIHIIQFVAKIIMLKTDKIWLCGV